MTVSRDDTFQLEFVNSSDSAISKLTTVVSSPSVGSESIIRVAESFEFANCGASAGANFGVTFGTFTVSEVAIEANGTCTISIPVNLSPSVSIGPVSLLCYADILHDR